MHTRTNVRTHAQFVFYVTVYITVTHTPVSVNSDENFGAEGLNISRPSCIFESWKDM
jgi:hypothetical protein